MDDFLSRVEKEMINLRKRNLNIINEFKIEMYQGRKNINRQFLQKQYGKINPQNKSSISHLPNQQISSFIKKDTHSILYDNQIHEKLFYNTSKRTSSQGYSTNHNSRVQKTVESRFHNKQGLEQNNKENQNPNIRIKTDISLNQYESFGNKMQENHHQKSYEIQPKNNELFTTNQDGFDLNALKNDQSMEINTEQVKNKYMKFISPSAGWTVSAASKRENEERKGVHAEEHPLCSSFVHEPKYFETEQNEQIQKDFDLFGFKGIDQCQLSKRSTIQQLVDAQNFAQSFNQ